MTILLRKPLVFIVIAALLWSSCSVAPEPSASRLRDDSDSASVGFTISNDGLANRTQLEIRFGNFETRGNRDADRGGRREPEGLGPLFREIVSLFDGDDAPDGEPAESAGKALTREAGEVNFRVDADTPAAKRSGKTEEREERYRNLAEARVAIEAKVDGAIATSDERRAQTENAARALEAVVANAVGGHNQAVREIVVDEQALLDAVASLPRPAFRTDAATHGGARLRATARYIDDARLRVQSVQGPERLAKEQLIAVAESALAAADEYYSQGDTAAGDFAVELAYATTEMALSFVPGVGWSIDVYKAISGKDLLGRPLSTFDRGAAIFCAATVGLGAVALKSGKAIAVISKVIRGTEEAEALQQAARLEAKLARVSEIATPHGPGVQEMTAEAIAARESVENGATMYRGILTGRSQREGAQFWSLENPRSPGFAERYGIPPENALFDHVDTARLRPGAEFITRYAPGVGHNGGGALEVVINPGDIIDYATAPF